MKRQMIEHTDIVNPHSFKNPVCQGTFDCLPKIYGSIKVKIMKNKLHFYEQLQKRSKPKIRKTDYLDSSEERENSRKKRTKTKLEAESREKSKPGLSQLRTSKVKISNQFSDKFHKMRVSKREKTDPKSCTGTDDQQSRHKVKFNTLHFLPGIRHLNSKAQKPQTLSELIEGKIAKSIDVSNPLVHLYKSKNKLKVRNNFNGQIKEELEEDSRRVSTTEKYVPRQIQKSMKSKQQMSSPDNNYHQNSRMKTEPSADKEEFNSTKKFSGFMTEFSKRLLNQSSHRFLQTKMGRSQTKFHIPSKDEYKEFIQSYQSVSPGFQMAKIVEKKSFQIISYDNAVYFGQFSTEKEGLGVLVAEDSIFQGYFEKDQKHKGVQVTYDGVYIGKFVNGLRQGRGKFQWNNGEQYEGGWQEGKKHGLGTWKSPNGDYYEGEWFKGRQQGNGVHHHHSSTYKGEFMTSLKHGNGEELFANGDKYSGMYLKGRPHGKGRYDWQDGSYYDGQFSEGYREGKGELREHNGSFYKAKVPSGEIQNTVLVKRHRSQGKSSWGSSRTASGSTALRQNDDLQSKYFKSIEIRRGRGRRRQTS